MDQEDNNDNNDNDDRLNLVKSLGDRMKEYESVSEQRVPRESPFIVRLDGSSFSNFTRPLKKPFDNRFVCAMVSTMNDMIEKFHPRTGYCHSDEITLIFDSAVSAKDIALNKPNLGTHIFDGRIQKICSTFAGYCSVRFNYWLKEYIKFTLNDTDSHRPHTFDESFFDARVLIISSHTEIVNHMIWRSCRDCIRNAISTYAQNNFPHKLLENKSSEQKIAMLQTKGIDWNKDVPLYLKYGVYAKKELYEIETNVNGAIIKTLRSKIVNRCFIISCTDDFMKMMVSKTWDIALCQSLGFEVFSLDKIEL